MANILPYGCFYTIRLGAEVLDRLGSALTVTSIIMISENIYRYQTRDQDNVDRFVQEITAGGAMFVVGETIKRVAVWYRGYAKEGLDKLATAHNASKIKDIKTL